MPRWLRGLSLGAAIQLVFVFTEASPHIWLGPAKTKARVTFPSVAVPFPRPGSHSNMRFTV